MKPDPRIVKKLKRYDPQLYVQWNNQEKVWEVWRTMPHGKRLVTPVNEFIHTIKKEDVKKYSPLDNRIIKWVYMADSHNRNTKQSIKYLRDKNKKEFLRKEREINPIVREKMEYIARENFYIANRVALNPYIQLLGAPGFDRPDCPTNSGRVSTRSGANARKHFGDNE